MFYIIYKITNLIDGKIYIGAHKTSNLNDSYMGSGKVLIRAQNKYGIENFKKEILEVFDNPEEMFEMESTLVNEDFVNRKDTYNLKEGGYGGFDFINSNGLSTRHMSFSDMSKKGIDALQKKLKNDDNFRKKYLLNAKKALKIANKINKERYDSGECGPFKGRSHTDETKKKMSESQKGKQKGKLNSQYGTMWVYSLKEKRSKKIKKEDLSEMESKGWIKGRKLKFF